MEKVRSGEDYEKRLRETRFGLTGNVTSAEIRALPPVRNLQVLRRPSPLGGKIVRHLVRLSTEEHLRRTRSAYRFLSASHSTFVGPMPGSASESPQRLADCDRQAIS